MEKPFDTLRELIRNESKVKKQGEQTLSEWIERFAVATLGRLQPETCEAGYLDPEDNWQSGIYPLKGEYNFFNLRISISDEEGHHLEYIYLEFLAKLLGAFQMVLHSEDLKLLSVGRTAHITFAEKENSRFDDALTVFDAAIHHITSKRILGRS